MGDRAATADGKRSLVTLLSSLVKSQSATAGRITLSFLGPGPTDTNGRGLQIVEAISDRWEVIQTRPGGKTVAFVISLGAEALST
jgi:hypothetical protein